MQERAVRPPVDDVERGLQDAEERQRRPQQCRAADDPERRGVVLHGMHEPDDLVDRRAWERALDFLDQEARLVRAPREPQERQREKGQRHE